MLAAAAIALGLVLGIAAGGRFANLGLVTLNGQGLMLILFIVQGISREAGAQVLGRFALAVWAACSIALCVLMFLQSSLPGLAIAGLGVGLNTMVVLANSGMPVGVTSELAPLARDAVAVSNGFYHIADERTSLLLLADILPAGPGVASIGDVLLAVGVSAFLVFAIVGADRPSSSKLHSPRARE